MQYPYSVGIVVFVVVVVVVVVFVVVKGTGGRWLKVCTTVESMFHPNSVQLAATLLFAVE